MKLVAKLASFDATLKRAYLNESQGRKTTGLRIRCGARRIYDSGVARVKMEASGANNSYTLLNTPGMGIRVYVRESALQG